MTRRVGDAGVILKSLSVLGSKGRRRLRALLALIAVLPLWSCSETADEGAFAAERSKPIQRYDVVLSAAANGSVAVAGLQSGAMVTSADDGAAWRRHALPGASIIDIATCPDQSFIALDFYGKVWSSDAAGENWHDAKLEGPATALTVTCDATGRWWVSGTNATLAVSADKGATWAVTDLHQDAQITALTWIDERQAIAMGEFGLVAATRDSGRTWAKVAVIPGDFYPYAVHFMSATEGYASGIAGQILHTRDGGLNWEKMRNDTGAPLYRLVAGQGRLYGIGAAGIVAVLNGDCWQALEYPNPLPVFLSAAARLPGAGDKILIGGPGGLIRVVEAAEFSK